MNDSCLIDSNILLRFVKDDDGDYPLVRRALAKLWAGGKTLCYTSQNLGEFWNTCTRPADRNGYGLTISETDQRVRLIEGQFTLVDGGGAVHEEWRRLLVENAVAGAQVHDARLAATMLVLGIEAILTFNVRDFTRYAGIKAVHPLDV